MARRFRLITNTDPDTGRKISFGVSDITDEEYEVEKKLAKTRDVTARHKYSINEEMRPRLATFMVSGLYGADEQEKMAQALCEFMNKVADSREQALQQNSLVEVLTSKAAEYNTKEEDDNAV
jgi:hypothetical protein